jgi:hypothetical protein
VTNLSPSHLEIDHRKRSEALLPFRVHLGLRRRPSAMPPRPQTRFLSMSSGTLSETSPLLRARYSNGYNDPPPPFGVPAILPAIASLPPPTTLTTSSLYHAVPFLQSLQRTEQVAWVLCTLLYLYTEAAAGGWNSTHGTWERWKTIEDAREGRNNIEKLIGATWNEFVEVWKDVENPGRAGDAVEDVLWTSIPLEEGGKKWIRGIMITNTRWSAHKSDATDSH